MPPTSIDLAVVIVNFERPEDTIECVRSIQKSSYSPMRIVLVDNGSRDHSVQHLQAAFPDLAILQLEENLFFAGGFNIGIRAALESGASHIFVLNNDTTLEPDTLEQLMSGEWDVAIPKIMLYDQPNIIWSAGAHWRRFPPGVVINHFMKASGPNDPKAGPLDYATGCAFLARRSVFEAVGLFDEEFGYYQEDYDFFYRVQAANISVGYVPTAVVYHKVSRTAGRNPQRQRYYMARNTILFFGKPGRFPAWYKWVGAGWILVREAIKGHFSHLKDHWQGYRAGFSIIKSWKKG